MRRAPASGPWVLQGRETGRGPDNEPLVAEVRPMCWIDPGVIDEARAEVENQTHDWGPLDRTGHGRGS